MIVYSRNAFLAENQNGPYGPYEQFFKDGKGNYWQKTRGQKNWKIGFEVQNGIF